MTNQDYKNTLRKAVNSFDILGDYHSLVVMNRIVQNIINDDEECPIEVAEAILGTHSHEFLALKQRRKT